MTVSLHTKPRRPETVVPSSALLVLQPPGHLFLTPQLLTPGEYRIGSSSDCDIVLEADGVAAEQALLTVDVTGVRLRTLEGLTWVNDFPVTKAALRRGDRVSFGPLTFTLRASTPDDLLAYLPSQDLQPVETLPPEPRSTPAVMKTLDTAITHLEAAQAIGEPSLEPVAATAPIVTELDTTPVAEVVTADEVAPTVEVAEDVLDEEPPPPITLTTPAIAAEVAAWQAERAAETEELRVRQTDLAIRAAGLEEREARLASWDDRLIRREAILDQRHAELDGQRTALDQREAALTEERLRLERIIETAQADLAAEAEKQATAWTDWETTQRRLSAELNDEFAALQDVEAACNAAKAQLLADQQAWSETRTAWQTERAEWEARRHEQQQQLVEWEAEAQQLRDELARERIQLAEQRTELQAEACQRSTAHRELIAARQETQRERRLLAEQQSAWIAEREAEWLELRERRRRLDVDVREVEELRQQTQQAWTEAETARQAALTAASTEAVPIASITTAIEETVAAGEIEESLDIPPVEESTAATEIVAPAEEISPIPTPMATDPDAIRDWMETSFDDLPTETAPVASTWSPETPFPATSILPVAEQSPVEVLPPDVPLSSIADRFHNAWIAQAPEPSDSATESAVSAIDVEVPTESPPATTTFTEETEPAAEKDLHAELAKMFGLPEDFGHHAGHSEEAAVPADDPTAEVSFLDEPAYESTASETDAENDAEVAATDEDDAWRSQLAEVLTAQETPARIEPATTTPGFAASTFVTPAAPPVAPPPAPAPEPQPEEDSIAAYMQRLLARNRMSDSSTPTAPPIETITATTTVATRSPSLYSEDPATENLGATTNEVTESSVSLPVPEPRQRVDKDEVRAALQSFREVANLSARSAIAQHSTKTLRGEVTVQAVLAGLAGVAAAAYWMPPLWGGSLQLLPGAGCLIAAGWMGWQIRQSLHRLQTWNPGDRLEINDNPESSEDAMSGELMDEVTAAVIDNRHADVPVDDEPAPPVAETVTEPTEIGELSPFSEPVAESSDDANGEIVS